MDNLNGIIQFSVGFYHFLEVVGSILYNFIDIKLLNYCYFFHITLIFYTLEIFDIFPFKKTYFLLYNLVIL